MSAGYIQLAAIGQQDAYLTGSPQVTYFSGVYRRHTPFVLEAYDIPFLEQKVNYGQNNICRIPAKGDLIRGLTLKLSLPALNNPGSDWTWPTPPAAVKNEPHIRLNIPVSGGVPGANVTISATLVVSSYSTNNTSQWLTSPFGSYIRWDSGINKFIFSNCASVEVEPRTDYLAPGVFWGLDPKAASFVASSGNLVYTVNTSNLVSNSAINTFSNNFISTIVRTGDFTLEQAGWIRSEGTLPPDPKLGLFAYLNQPYNISGQQFLNFSGTSGSGSYWTFPDPNSKFFKTTGGRIQFTSTGLYALKAGFELGAGSIQTLSFGSSTNEAVEGSAPLNPNFETTYTFRVSPDPSMPAVIPMNVTSL